MLSNRNNFIINRIFFLLILCCFTNILFGMTFDNRHFPLIDKPILHRQPCGFFIRGQPFFMFADGSFGFNSKQDGLEMEDEDMGLFDIYGLYNEVVLNRALIKYGAVSNIIIPPDLATLKLLWTQQGRLDAAGLALRWYYAFSPNWEIGGSWLFMGARSRLELVFLEKKLNLNDGDIRDLLVANNKLFHLDGLHDLLWHKVGTGDLDLYLRFGWLRNYFLKLKSFNIGIKFGAIVPLAASRDLNNPASLSFGGNGHWGLYWDFAIDTELKEDWFAGFNFRIIRRLPKVQEIRLPIEREPLNFAVAKGTAKVDPGLTFVFMPYFALEDFRGGFGAQFSYTLMVHQEDNISDIILKKKTLLNIQSFKERSGWSSEYITCSLLYDFGHDQEYRGCLPRLALDVDVPFGIFTSTRSNKTFGIALRIESNIW